MINRDGSCRIRVEEADKDWLIEYHIDRLRVLLNGSSRLDEVLKTVSDMGLKLTIKEGGHHDESKRAEESGLRP
jgi:hypothetical protein